MSALLSGLLIQAITLVIGKLANATKDDWEKVKGWVVAAENRKEPGALRGAWVKEQIKGALPHLAPFARDLLISLAVGLLNKQGRINVKM